MCIRDRAGSDVLLSTCYRDFVEKHPHIAHKTVYTGLPASCMV